MRWLWYGQRSPDSHARNIEEDRKPSYISARTSQYNVNNVCSSNFSAPDVQHSDLLSETRPFLCRIAMAKAAFNEKRAVFTSTLDLELRKKLVKC